MSKRMKKMNVNGDDVFNLPDLVSQQKISVKDALNLIGEEITRHPFKFGITGNASEIASDLYFAILKNGHFLFDHYRKDYCTFKTYLCSFIRYQIKSIKRENYNQYEKQRTFEQVEGTEYESAKEKYEKNEFEYKIMHFKPYSLSEKEKAPYIRKKQLKKLPEELKNAPGNDLSVADVLCDFTKSNETKRKLTLVIALKSCYYLSEENLSTIARFCRVDFEMFMKAIDSLKLTLGEKQKRYEKLKDKRDFSYYQHRKCMERLQDRKDFYLPTDDIERLCKFHTEKWINKTSFLQNKSYKVCPTNKSIANILGICERQVGYYLNHADDLLKIDKAEVEAAKCQS